MTTAGRADFHLPPVARARAAMRVLQAEVEVRPTAATSGFHLADRPVPARASDHRGPGRTTDVEAVRRTTEQEQP